MSNPRSNPRSVLQPKYRHDLPQLGGRLFIIVGEAPVMNARLVRRTAEDAWTSESLFETVVDSLINARRPLPFPPTANHANTIGKNRKTGKPQMYPKAKCTFLREADAMFLTQKRELAGAMAGMASKVGCSQTPITDFGRQ